MHVYVYVCVLCENEYDYMDNNYAESRIARPCSAPRERVWDILTIERPVGQECNPVMMLAIMITKIRLATLLHSRLNVYCV